MGRSELPGRRGFGTDPKAEEIRKDRSSPQKEHAQKAACPLKDPGQENVLPFYRGQRGQMGQREVAQSQSLIPQQINPGWKGKPEGGPI